MSWTETPSARLSQDGRLRLVHGPIDLIVTLKGSPDAVQSAYNRANKAFQPILNSLVSELPRLRSNSGPQVTGDVARRMQRAVSRFAPTFITPMAAVAGSVADHILAAILTHDHGLSQAHVNNGGDIALWTVKEPLRLTVCDDPISRTLGAEAQIGPRDGIGGVATSGWRGRSHSMGIADAVTVLAKSAAVADAAATLIANSVNLTDHPAITRAPADTLSPDSDLGTRPVTVDVGPLVPSEAQQALANGAKLADHYRKQGLISAACLACQGERITIGDLVTRKELSHA